MRRVIASALLLLPLPSVHILACSSDPGATGSMAPAPDASSNDSGGSVNIPPPNAIDGGDTTSPDGAARGQDAGVATGTVAGHAFTVAHAVAYPKMVGANSSTQGYEILLSSGALDCSNYVVPNSTNVGIDIAGSPPVAQTYTVIEALVTSANASQAESDFNAFDSTCNGSSISASSVSGSVTITSFDAANVGGSFSVTYEDKQRTPQGTISGSFTAVVCPEFPTALCHP